MNQFGQVLFDTLAEALAAQAQRESAGEKVLIVSARCEQTGERKLGLQAVTTVKLFEKERTE